MVAELCGKGSSSSCDTWAMPGTWHPMAILLREQIRVADQAR